MIKQVAYIHTHTHTHTYIHPPTYYDVSTYNTAQHRTYVPAIGFPSSPTTVLLPTANISWTKSVVSNYIFICFEEIKSDKYCVKIALIKQVNSDKYWAEIVLTKLLI